MVKIKQTTPDVCQDVKWLDQSYFAGGNVNKMIDSHAGKHFCSFLKKTEYPSSMWSSNCIPGHLSQKNKDYVHTKTVHKYSFTAILFVIAPN